MFKDIHVEIGRNGRTGTAPVASFYSGQITPDDVRREFSSLFGPNDLPIIVIDEFDKIKSFETRELMANTLKSLSDFGVNVTIVLVGVADDVNDLIVGHPSVTRCIEQILMPRMEVKEREEILDKRIGRLGMSMKPSSALKITNLSRGLPSYVHSLGLASVQSALGRESLRVEDADVDQALGKVLSRSHQSIQEAYLQAIHSNRKDNLYGEVLLACALADTDEKGLFTPLSVSEPLSLVLKKDKLISISTYQSHLLKFMEHARANVLVRRGRERAYRFRFKDPIMQPYVIMKGIEAGLIGKDAIDVLPPSFRRKMSAT